MKKIYLFLLICIGVFAYTADINAQSTQGGSTTTSYAEKVTDYNTIVAIIDLACDDFGFCFDDMMTEYRLGNVGIIKVEESTFRVSYGGGNVIIAISGF